MGSLLIAGNLLAMTAVTGALLARRPGHPVTLLLTVMTVARALLEVAGDPFVNPLWALSYMPLSPLLIAFPDGPRGGWRPVFWYLLIAIGLVVTVVPVISEVSPAAGTAVAVVLAGPILPIALIRTVDLFRGWLHARGLRRQRIGLVLVAAGIVLFPYFVLPLIGLILPDSIEHRLEIPETVDVFTLLFTLIPLAVGLSTLLEPVGRRRRVVEAVWPPTLAVGSALLLGGTLLSLGMALADGTVTALAPGISLGVVAAVTVWGTALVLRSPLHALTPQERSAATLADVAETMQRAPGVDAAPALAIRDIGRSLDALGARVLGAEGGEIGSWGSPGGNPVTVPLVSAGRVVGSLELTAHHDGVALDLPALEPLLPPLAAAVEAAELTAALQQSHEQLRQARDRERERLRADLHDELSPALSGSRLAVHAARGMVGQGDREPVLRLLDQLEDGLATAAETVREILEDLRPGALVHRDLRTAIESRAARFHRPGVFDVRVSVGALPPLSSQTEVAILRVAGEAVCNAARHSEGTACTVTLRPEAGGVSLRVLDDGTGIGPSQGQGVGLGSMLARATAAGGRLKVSPGPAGGTLVAAWFAAGEAL